MRDASAILDSIDSPVFSEEKLAFFSVLNPLVDKAIPALGRGLATAGKKVMDMGGRFTAPAVQRFQQGAKAGLKKYQGALTDRMLDRSARGVAGPMGAFSRGVERAREGLATVGGGLGEMWGGSMAGRGLNALTSRNSNLWRGGVGQVLGRDPLTAAFNVYAGVEGARKGKEVGGWGGAIAGGLGGFGASRAAWAMGDVMKRGLLRDMQHQLAAGKMLGARARPGAIRNAVGGWLQRGGQAAENMSNKYLGGFGAQRIRSAADAAGSRLQSVAQNATRRAVKLPDGSTKMLAVADNPMMHGTSGMPALSAAITLPTSIATMLLATSGAEKLTEGGFNQYKRMAAAQHQRRQRDIAQENYMRRMSPEFRTTGYNPYQNYAR